jgi:S-DNA-T family DNA segregation ATPase FtsK/SpoIIIE
MAKRKPSTEKVAEKSEIKRSFFTFLKTKQTQTIFGFFLMLFSLFLCIAFISFFFNWQEDQSTIHQLSNRAVKSENLLGKIGANLGHFLFTKVLVLLHL